ncbi:putative glycosyl transferase, partial [Golovinomyces cichoracearum]
MSDSKHQDLKDVETIVWSSNQANTANVNEIEKYIIKTAHFKVLREFLRSRNVFIPKFGLQIGQQLSKSLTEGWKQMPDDQMPDVEMIYRPVEYQKGSDVHERPTIVTKDKGQEDVRQSNISHAWTNLVKLYSDDDKYAGSVNESLKLKMRIFNGNCELAGISLKDRNKAVRVMLKGAALSHYYRICKENEQQPSFDTICESLKTQFEGSEHKSATLARWNSISLFKIIELQEDKEDIEKAFRSLVTNLD